MGGVSTAGDHEPTDDEVRELLRRTRTIAVVGVSQNPARPSHGVAEYLLRSTPYEVWFVNPNATTVLGRPVHASLADLPAAPDLVDVFRRQDDLPSVLEDVLAVGAPALWLQLGLRHDDVARRAREAGLAVVQDRCLKVEHRRLRP